MDAPEIAALAVLLSLLSLLAAIDVRRRILPNVLVYPGIVAALAAAPILPAGGYVGAVAGGVLAFVEVKCRRGSSMGTAAESLSPAKQRRMVEMAEAYGLAREELPEQWRIDLIAIDFEREGRRASLVHYENAVTGEV